MKPKISVIIPLFNEEEVLPSTYQAVTDELKKGSPEFNYEIIFVNDGSSDKSSVALASFYEKDPGHVVVLNFVRNFGQVPAMLAGFSHASGDCIVNMSADLQDPPSLISEMFRKWQEGNKLVLAVRESREDRFMDRLTSKIFYGLMQKFVNPAIPEGGFDYFLMDRSLNEMVLKMEERNIFIQGHILWPGIKPVYLTYNRKKREMGKSHWPFLKKLKYSIDGFAAYSFFPIRLMSWVGLTTFLLGILFSVGILFQRIFWGTGMPGWSSIMIAMLFLNGIQMMITGVMGEYLWRNFDETRKRPLYLIDSVWSSQLQRSGVTLR